MNNSKRHNILILKFPYSSTYGGGEKHTIRLVEKLDNYNFYLLSTCSVLISEFKKRDWNVNTAWAGTEPVTPTSLVLFFFTAPFVSLNLLRLLILYKRKHNIDTIYCLSLTEKILLTPWAKLMGIRIFWMEHLQIERWLLKSPLRIFYVLWSKFVTIITVVEAVQDQLTKIGIAKENTQVIYNSVNIKQFIQHPSEPEKVKNNYSILFVGRLAREKGIDDLLQAIKIVKLQIPHINLTIVGKGEQKEQLEKITEELQLSDTITFTGFQDDIVSSMQQCDALVLPSTRRETFGIVTAEALASMKPVIATTTGGLSEVVGKHGWLVEPSKPTQIADALLEIYHDYPAALEKTRRGRLHVLELFREERMLKEYDNIFA